MGGSPNSESADLILGDGKIYGGCAEPNVACFALHPVLRPSVSRFGASNTHNGPGDFRGFDYSCCYIVMVR